MPLGDNIKKYRELKNWGVQQLADKMGIGKAGVYKWESGETKPGQDSLTALSKALDVTVDDLLNENSTPEQKSMDNDEKIDSQEDVYRNIVEGNTEYILIPRSVLQEKYRLVALEQFQKDKEQLEKDKAIIDKLLSMNESLVAEIRSMKTQVPELQKAQ